jgi:hypothetical protein
MRRVFLLLHRRPRRICRKYVAQEWSANQVYGFDRSDRTGGQFKSQIVSMWAVSFCRSRQGVVMFRRVAVTLSALAFVMLAVALALGVPTVLATVRATATNEDAKLDQPFAQQSCAAFETWFLDPSCRQPHVKKIAGMKKH